MQGTFQKENPATNISDSMGNHDKAPKTKFNIFRLLLKIWVYFQAYKLGDSGFSDFKVSRYCEGYSFRSIRGP